MEHEFRDAEMALTLAEMRSDVDKLVTKLSVKADTEAGEAGDTVALIGGGDGAAPTTHASEMLMKVIQKVEKLRLAPQLASSQGCSLLSGGNLSRASPSGSTW